MTHRTRTSFVIGFSLALALVLAAGSTVQAGSAAPAGGMQMTETQMKDHCKDMMEQKRKLAADTKSQDAELTELVAKMNRAPGDKQMTLMAATITQIVEQQVAMDQRKAKMEDEMMAHMMQHMQMGKDSMAQCPMMKDMNDMKGMTTMPGMKSVDDKSAGAH
jgi:hypothetical protein